MADASGTPTPLGIPTFNTAVDPPSGKGFNTAMSVIDTLLSTRATETLTSNTKTALQLSGASAGLTIGGDTTLYRALANRVASDGEVHARLGVSGEVGMGAWGPSGQAGFTFSNLHDTNLYRNAAGSLKTDGQFSLGAGSPLTLPTPAAFTGTKFTAQLQEYMSNNVRVNGGAGSISIFTLGTVYSSGIAFINYSNSTNSGDQGFAVVAFRVDSVGSTLTVLANIGSSGSGATATLGAAGGGVGTTKTLNASMPGPNNWDFTTTIFLIQ